MADINDAREGDVPCHYFTEEERVSILLIVNLILVEEKQGRTVPFFLILHAYVLPTSTKETTRNPAIDSAIFYQLEEIHICVKFVKEEAHVDATSFFYFYLIFNFFW